MRNNNNTKVLAKIVLGNLNVIKLFFRVIFPIFPSIYCSITSIFVLVASVELPLLMPLLKILIANMTGACLSGGLLRVRRLKTRVHLTLARRRLILAWTRL